MYIYRYIYLNIIYMDPASLFHISLKILTNYIESTVSFVAPVATKSQQFKARVHSDKSASCLTRRATITNGVPGGKPFARSVQAAKCDDMFTRSEHNPPGLNGYIICLFVIVVGLNLVTHILTI